MRELDRRGICMLTYVTSVIKLEGIFYEDSEIYKHK